MNEHVSVLTRATAEEWMGIPNWHATAASVCTYPVVESPLGALAGVHPVPK